jgi:hypothetical protein
MSSDQVVYLHVGAPKTGTTFVQDRLFRNRESLRDHGILYPADRFDAQFVAALDLEELSWGGLGERAKGAWDALAASVRDWPGTAIISHEILAAANPEQVRRALDSLAPAEVHIVYSARDLARQIPAEWQEGVKHQRVESFDRFLRLDVGYGRGTTERTWFWSVQDWPDVLSRWSPGIPPERVHLVTVPPSGAPPDLLWGRFCELFAIDPEWCSADSDRMNSSLGAAETRLLRDLNRRVKGHLTNPQYRSLVRELLAHNVLARREDSSRVVVNDRTRLMARELTERWIREVTARGYDVIGDLDEVRLVGPETGEGSAAPDQQDPDHPDPRDVYDASLDAIQALLVDDAEVRQQLSQTQNQLREVSERLREYEGMPPVQVAKRWFVRLSERRAWARVTLRGYRRLRHP